MCVLGFRAIAVIKGFRHFDAATIRVSVRVLRFGVPGGPLN